MERLQLQNYWASLVRVFKDREHQEHDVRYYDGEQIAQTILDYVRYTKIRQWTLFIERRGEEYDRMLAFLEGKSLSLPSITRFVEDEELWKTTLEMATL